MEWTDQGLVIAVQKHGEGSAILELITRDHGRHKGLLRGASSARNRGAIQQGNRVEARWRGRLSEHLGAFNLELERAHAAAIMQRSDALLALSSLCAIAAIALPEREPHAGIFEATCRVVELFEEDQANLAIVAQALAQWELGLLGALGYALDLSCCAVTGETENLIFVSPRSGRAVSKVGAGDFATRLLPLPGFMVNAEKTPIDKTDLLNGLELTGFFLERHIFHPNSKHLPPARQRFFQHLVKSNATSSG